MERHFIVTISTKTQGKITALLKYSHLGELVLVEIRDYTNRIGPDALQWVYDQLPKTCGSAGPKAMHPRVTIVEVDTDLSFEAFWEAFDYKVGTKSRAEKHWNNLDQATRALAMQKVKEYKFFIAHQNTNRIYPERWLSQKRYENDYKSAL